MKILWLGQYEIKSLLDITHVTKAVEEAFRQHGLKNVQMPPKSYLYFDKYNGDLRSMPGYLEDIEMAGVKVVNVHPDNREKGLPTVMATIILNDPETGRPLAVMDGTQITDYRTGAAGAVAAKYLARKDSKTMGLVGTGNQARTQLLATSKEFELEKVLVFGHHPQGAIRFKEDMEEILPGIDIVQKDKIKEVCNSDILTTITPSRLPLVKKQWVQEGTHINAIGADAKGKEELDPGILKKAKLVVDDIAQASHSGEINVPLSDGKIKLEDIYCELGEIVAGKRPGREGNEITIFDSTGLAIQDISTANLAYNIAKKEGIGKWL